MRTQYIVQHLHGFVKGLWTTKIADSLQPRLYLSSRYILATRTMHVSACLLYSACLKELQTLGLSVAGSC